ncbi:unnamed protein product [Protopolystoma xenopodis]|uniref:Uncharacterized protein n=1 Tax=Protopolystoma xenopodis TaxID=117903 RepID=A0A3S5AIX4_9PLAT|nr:unnamed protein product [Protopolystoma xenopodis]
MVEYLLRNGAEIDCTARNGFTPLHIAAKQGNHELASLLLVHNASVDAISRGGYTPLHFAAREGNVELVKKLLHDYSAKVNAVAKVRNKDRLACVEVLLAAGADVYATSAISGFTPLHNAAYQGHLGAVRCLLSSLGDEEDARAELLASRTRSGSTALHLAAQQGCMQVVNRLLEAGINPNARNLVCR